MSELLNSYHYSRSVALRAFAAAAQFAHVPLKEIEAAIDENLSPVLVDKIGEARTTTIRVKAVYAQNVLFALREKFGTLCPVCLCPVEFTPDDVSGYLARHRFAGDMAAWLRVGNATTATGPIHGFCEDAYILVHSVEYFEDPEAFDRVFRRAFKQLRSHLPSVRKPLRFNPRLEPEWDGYPGMREDGSYDESDIDNSWWLAPGKVAALLPEVTA
jgi:hypothetical protein